MSLYTNGAPARGVELPAGSVFTTHPTAFTFEAWCKVGSLTSARGLAGFGNNSWAPYLDSAKPAFYDTSGGGRVGTTALTTSAWAHVAVTYAAGTFRFYVNGSLTGSVASTYTKAGTSTTDSQRNLLRGTPHLSAYLGLISDIRIWNVARSGTEIAGHYEERLTGSETGLIGYWKLNETTGTTAADATGRGATGTFVVGGSADLSWNADEPPPFSGGPPPAIPRVIQPVWIGL